MTLCTRDVTTFSALAAGDFSGDVSSTLCTAVGRDDEGYGYSFIAGSTPENYCFDPADPDVVTVSEFCKTLKISRRSFYTIRSRYAEESQAALHPRSSAPHTTQRIYDESVTRVLLAARADLKSRG